MVIDSVPLVQNSFYVENFVHFILNIKMLNYDLDIQSLFYFFRKIYDSQSPYMLIEKKKNLKKERDMLKKEVTFFAS